MASSSPISCLQCRKSDSSSEHFKDGWRLRNGEFAQLCPSCAHVYDEGKFCETFHSNDDGWRDCESCGKLVHCGCVVSFNAYMLLDYGGIVCIECSRMNFIMARNRCVGLEKNLTGDSEMRHNSLIVPQAISPNKKLNSEYSELVGTPSLEE